MTAMNGTTTKKAHIAGETQHGLDWITQANDSLREAANQQDSSDGFWADFDDVCSAAEMAEAYGERLEDDADESDRPLENEPEIPEPVVISDEAWARAGELFGFQSSIEFAKSAPIKFLVDGLLIEGGHGMICAPAKALKTTLSLDLAISLASGEPFLGCFAIPEQVRVAVMTGESGKATVNETIERICRAKGVNRLSLKDSLIITEKIPKLHQPDSMNKLFECVKLLRPRVLIVDPIYKALDGKEASNRIVMGNQLDEFSALGCTVLFNHHTNSNGKVSSQPLGLDAASHAGFEEWVRQWFMLNRRKRYKPGSGHHEINLAYGGSAGQSGVLKVVLDEGRNSAVEGRDYQLTVERLDGESANSDESEQSKQAARSERKYERLKQALKDYPSGLSQSRIAAVLNINPQATKTLLEAAKKDKVVGSREGKSGNQNCWMYFLVQEPF